MKIDFRYARSVAILLATLALASQARASCRVLESRGDYLGYAKLYKVESPIFRIKNPYQTLAASTVLTDRKRARAALLTEFKSTRYEGSNLREIPRTVMLAAQEKAGVNLLLQTHIADYALIYGSARVKDDASISLTYKLINVRDGSHLDRVLVVPAARAQRLRTAVCARLNCQGEGDDESRIPTGSALKTIIGVELAAQLSSCH